MQNLLTRSIMTFVRSAWAKRLMLAVLGGCAGFGYYYFVGCSNGTCPITGNPYISTAYGAVIGLLLISGEKSGSHIS